MRRVVITGMGTVSPLGLDTPSTWSAALAGESGIDFIQSFDASEFPVRVAAEVKGFEPPDVVPLRRDAEESARARDASARGERLLADGAVGYVMVAGGQGSRLGFDGPKGVFPIAYATA